MHPAKVACFIGVTGLFFALAGCSGDDGRPTGPGTGTGTGGGANNKTPSTSTTSDTSPSTPAPSTSGTAAAPAAKKANAQGPCTSGDECESGVCFVGGNQSYCAVKCTTDTAATACAAPFTGACNKQGYCKRD